MKSRWINCGGIRSLIALQWALNRAVRYSRYKRCPAVMNRSATTAGNIAGFSLHARLAALVPRPRVNLTRYHGVFAPNSKYRALITPAKRGKGNKPGIADEPDEQTPVPHHVAMTPDQVRGRLWAQRLKRVFNIDVETCRACGGRARVIACIEDPQVIKKILAHLVKKAPDDSRPHP